MCHSCIYHSSFAVLKVRTRPASVPPLSGSPLVAYPVGVVCGTVPAHPFRGGQRPVVRPSSGPARGPSARVGRLLSGPESAADAAKLLRIDRRADTHTPGRTRVWPCVSAARGVPADLGGGMWPLCQPGRLSGAAMWMTS